MKIRFASDLHLERCHTTTEVKDYLKLLLPESTFSESCYSPKENESVLILAGDIGHVSQLPLIFDTLLRRFGAIVYVAGNHEFYNTGFEAFEATIKNLEKVQNLHILENGSIDIEGVRFIGATMWFPYDPMNVIFRNLLNDFRCIPRFEPKIYEKNRESVEYLSLNIRKGDIVITHHLPLYYSVPEEFKNDETNRFFVCNMSIPIIQRKPAIWIHGHTHTRLSYTFCNTEIVCNPFGYPYGTINESFREYDMIDTKYFTK